MLISTVINSCKRPVNYLDQNEPLYLENWCDGGGLAGKDTLSLTTFNIERGARISEAIGLIVNNPKLSCSDIFLLQEMDAEGTRQIAEALNMNYLYIPINNELGTQKDFGNSIITRGQIIQPEKLILPHGQFHNGRIRSACIATLVIDSLKFRIVSSHFATVFMSSKKRIEQFNFLEKYISKDTSRYDGYIIGGDFNAVTSNFRRKIINKFRNLGFDYATAGIGITQSSNIPLIKPELDMVFSKGIQITNKGKVADNTASDHYPVWVEFVPGL